MFGQIAEGIASAVVGAVIGAVLTATAQARVAKRELDEADQANLRDRLETLEQWRATETGRRQGYKEGKSA